MKKSCGILLLGSLICFGFILFCTNYAWAELHLDSVTPVQGTLGEPLNVVLKGRGFDSGMRITMNRDIGNNEISVSTPGDANGVFVLGQTAYVADGKQGVQIIDISEPWTPYIVGSVDTPGSAENIFVSGTTAYVADGVKGLQVIDVSMASSPRLIGGVDTPDSALDVVVVDSIAYVTDRNKGLQIIDVSVPSSPRIIGSVDTPGRADGVAVSDQTVYVADWEGIQIVDVSNLSSPRIIGSLTLTGVSTPYSGSEDVILSGETLFVRHDSFFYIIDVSDASAPAIISELALPYGSKSMAMDGDMIYVREQVGGYNGWYTKIHAIDITNLADPQMSGSVSMFGESVVGGGMVVTERIAWVAGGPGLVALDVRNPVPTNHSFLYASGENDKYRSRGTISNVSMVNNIAYVADYSGLLVVDISRPAFPRVVGFVDTPQQATGIFIKGELAYMTCGDAYSSLDQTLQIIDVSNSSMPVIIGSVEFVDKINGITVQGDFAYVATGKGNDWGKNVHIVDVSNPFSPAIVASMITPKDV